VPDQPVLEFLSEDTLRVRMSTVLGLVAITCSDIVKTNRSLDAQVSVQVLGPPERDPVSDRCDLQSLWKTANLCKTLDQLYEIKGGGWTEILLKAFGMIREGFLNHDPSVDVSAIEAAEGEQDHVSELLSFNEANVIFGDGSAGKTVLCQNIMTCCAAGESFLGFDTLPGPWLFVDYEATPANFKRRIRRIVKAFGMEDIPPGLIHYWAARGTPIPDLIPALQKKVREKGIVGIVVDSAVAACGGDPVAPDVVIRYFNSLAKIGITSITIAHITKGGDTEKPFGSGFWHHMPRRTWYVERVQHEGSDVIDLALFNRKVNDGPKHAPIGVTMFFDGRDGEIRVQRSDLRDVPEFDAKRPLVDRLREALASGAHPIHTLAEKTGADTEAIRKCLQRYEGKHFVRINDSRGGPGNKTYWGLREEDSEETNRVAGIPF
jgi:hypothetical protein